jgi:UPF0716 family protein affecting phage T7 exclusion
MKKYLYFALFLVALFMMLKLFIVLGTLSTMLVLVLGVFGFFHIRDKIPGKKTLRSSRRQGKGYRKR